MEQRAASTVSLWSKLGVWYRASRPFTLPASVVPVLVGSALAFREGQADPGLFVLVLVASLLVQVGANLVDEYSDHGRVEEGGKMIAPYKVIALGLLSERAVKLGALTSFGLATLAGLYIVAVTGWPILVVSLASLAAAYLYAGGPKPLGAYAIGQPMVFVFMGLIMVMGTYYVHTQTLTVESLLLAAAVGCTVTAILVANDLRDREEDMGAGKSTPVTLWGRPFGRLLWTALVAAGFALPAALAVFGGMGLLLLLPFLALPRAYQAWRTLRHGNDRPAFLTGLRQSASLHWWYGVLLALGVGLGRFDWYLV